MRQVRSFLGLCSFFRTFVENFGRIAAPLHKLTAKDSPLKWTEQCEESFQKLKEKLISKPILIFPDFTGTKPFYLMTDASYQGFGCCLLQEDDQKPPKKHAINFHSRGLSKAEQNIQSSTLLEAIGLLWALRINKSIIWGFKTIVLNDCKNLIWLKDSKNLSDRLTRIATLISEFEVDIRAISGKQNRVSDCLSRLDLKRVPGANLPETTPEDELLIAATEETSLENNMTNPLI